MLRWPGRRLGLKIHRRGADLRDRLRARIVARRPTLALSAIERRLELTITALYGQPIPIAPTTTDVPSWTARMWELVSRRTDLRRATPTSDADVIHLPPELSARDGDRAALARYRLYAVEQAERIVRATSAHAPPSTDPLMRDLYLVREAATIDARIASAHPGMSDVLARERASALAQRPRLESLTVVEREVEMILRRALSTPISQAGGGGESDPGVSLAWAESTAATIRRLDARYRGVPPTQLWGTARSTEASTAPEQPPSTWRREESRPMEKIVARKFSGGRMEADSEASTGHSDKLSDRYSERGQTGGRPLDDPERGSQASDRPPPPNRPTPLREVAGSSAPPAANRQPPGIHDAALENLPPATAYDEWDGESGKYAKGGALVRVYEAPVGDAAWASEVLREHAALVRQVRHQFERLRARRTLLPRERSGDDLDIAACVTAIVDRRIGQLSDDRLYLDARPARRELAIAIVADISGSTKSRVSDEWRIIDLEKIALVLAAEALDALGDLFAIYTFAGKSAADVKLTTIKEFTDRGGELTRRRIAAIEPGGFTRLGAAVRHATSQLARQTAGHRLLLLLSDGRPNDVDRYQGTYGVEDSRRAIFEARAAGVYPFCLTVDANASEYLPRIFGRAGHTILQRPSQLPTALVGVVRALIRRS